MEITIKKNEELSKSLVKFMQGNIKINSENPPKVSAMLDLLLKSAKKNANKKTNGQRYDDVLKELGSLLYHVGGLQLYEILSQNLPLPSATTVRQLMYKQESIIEGEFRIKELKKFLEERKYPFKVCLSEDATVVAQRVQYHPRTNQVVGFPLPLNENGMPKVGAFPATTAEKIARYFSDNTACSSAYCIVAQPLVPKSPTFVVAMFGTDNKFTAQQVHLRWQWTLSAMAEEGVTVCSFASDGDARLLKCMSFNSVAMGSDTKWPWFQAKRSMTFVCVQDAIHIGNKLKSHLLSPSIILPFGKFLMASSGHLVELIQKHQLKDKHLLCISDINSKDKMNHAAMLKMSDKKVTELLQNRVEGSIATAFYLDMMREVVEAFTSVSLKPLERVNFIWKWVFYLRLWREKILKTPGYLRENAYHCIEINAHSLILSIIQFRDSEEHSLFLPWLMSSQPCEATFRDIRSKQVSFSILEMSNSLRRSDTLASSRLNLEGVVNFPRHHKAIIKSNAECHIPVSLPEDYELEQAVLSALSEAFENAVKVGLVNKNSPFFIPTSGLVGINPSEMGLEEDVEESEDISVVDESEKESDESSEDLINELPDVVEDLHIVSSGSLGLKTFTNVTLTETCPFVIVTDSTNEPAIIKKSTLCWLLRSGNTKISSDRLLRVQESSLTDGQSLCSQEVALPSKEPIISVSDWCAFLSEDGSIVAGRVLNFRYMTGTTRKNQVYSRLEAPTVAPDKNARGLGCLCSWFKIQKNLTLTPISMDIHGYYDIDNYICSIPRPQVVGKVLKLNCSLTVIKKFLK
ncbi:PDZ domain-containing protein 2 [Frankliniella fusca]|uniref:PDZ domain-containing protein 2 n=1 Tax=Frankliniella fusca TaxID=407009 RepID=A0AAE1I570_9NEOP|nr:PDZ domain-containing protein 2 [Frankliniella fusca]